MPIRVFEIRTIFLASRRKEVRCRLWYEVMPLRDGLQRHFLVGIEELDQHGESHVTERESCDSCLLSIA